MAQGNGSRDLSLDYYLGLVFRGTGPDRLPA